MANRQPLLHRSVAATHHVTVESPVGNLVLVADRSALRAVLWNDTEPEWRRAGLQHAASNINHAHPILCATVNYLTDWFDGGRSRYELPLAVDGTAFQQTVWNALTSIAYGTTVTYSDVAHTIGRPTAVRAVAAAIGRNPLSIVVPCHRVIGSNGSLTGFAGGLNAKRTLLTIEGTLTLAGAPTHHQF
jgi:methylated-DNA-[protein]-cysteine S-methyltransferase